MSKNVEHCLRLKCWLTDHVSSTPTHQHYFTCRILTQTFFNTHHFGAGIKSVNPIITREILTWIPRPLLDLQVLFQSYSHLRRSLPCLSRFYATQGKKILNTMYCPLKPDLSWLNFPEIGSTGRRCCCTHQLVIACLVDHWTTTVLLGDFRCTRYLITEW